MKTITRILNNYLGEYLERLLLVLFGVGLGVKILVVNHGIDPRTLNLDLMVADYILVMVAPLAATGLSILINRVMPREITQDDVDAVLDFMESEAS